jgi:hypothetical protein
MYWNESSYVISLTSDHGVSKENVVLGMKCLNPSGCAGRHCKSLASYAFYSVLRNSEPTY